MEGRSVNITHISAVFGRLRAPVVFSHSNRNELSITSLSKVGILQIFCLDR